MHSQHDCLSLEGMVFYGCHGVLPAEKEYPQKFVVSLWMETNIKPAARSDSLEASVDYSLIYKRVKQLVESNRFNLIETLAETIAEQVLSEQGVSRVKVRVEKPWAPLAGPVRCAAVEIRREAGKG